MKRYRVDGYMIISSSEYAKHLSIDTGLTNRKSVAQQESSLGPD